MDCRAARNAWHDRLDGPLDAERAARLERHLRNCADCQRFAAEMQPILAGLDGLRAESDSAMAERFPRSAVPKRLRLASGRAWRSYGRATRFAVAAAVLLAVAMGFYYARRPLKPDDARVAAPADVRAAAPLRFERARVRLVGSSAAEFLVVSEESRAPRVHIFHLHAVLPVTDAGAAATSALAAVGARPVEAGS